MTKRLWKLHSWLGLVCGLGLLVIGVTGSLLVFAPELEAQLRPKDIVVGDVHGPRLPLDTLLAKVQERSKGFELTGWQIRSEGERHWADLLFLRPHGSNERLVATLNPYTGTLLASPRSDVSTLTGWVLRLHYSFFAGRIGELVAGIFAVLLCILGVTGVWLYRDFWRSFLRLRWRASARIFFSDLHKTVGISSVAFNLILGFTGAYWNLTQVVAASFEGEREKSKMTKRLYADSISLERLNADCQTRLQGFALTFISFPIEREDGITLWGKVPSRNPFRSTYASTVLFDAQTGAFKQKKDIRTESVWTQCVDMFAPLHFGTFGGLTVKILWCLGGLAPGLLAVSGASIAWHRTRRAKNQKPDAGQGLAELSKVK